MRSVCIGLLTFFLVIGCDALWGDQVPPSAKGESDVPGKVSVVPAGEGVDLGPRQGSPPPLGGQAAKGIPAAQLAHMVAALMGMDKIKHYVDVALHDPDPMAEMVAFREVVNAVSAEDVAFVIQMLENENVQPSEWEAVLVPLSGVMSAKERQTILDALQLPVTNARAVAQLKQIYLFKKAVRVEKLAALMGKEKIKHYVDVALHDPDPMAEMVAFREVVNAVSAEDVAFVIQMLENENVQPSEWEAVLVPLSGVMSAKERQTILDALQLPVIKTWVAAEAKQIHLFKKAVRVEKLAALVGRDKIKHYVDVALHDPDPMAEMAAFREVVNAVNAEDVAFVIQMLENENIQPLEWEAALVPLSGVMSAKERQTILDALQLPVTKTRAVEQLKQIHLYKKSMQAGKCLL
jgi:hypothetical protein